VSCVGLTLGTGGEGARITSRMFFGGWLYPDALSIGLDCATMGAEVAQATKRSEQKTAQGVPDWHNSLRFHS